MSDFPNYLTINEAREILNVSRDAIYDLMNSGDLPYVELGSGTAKKRDGTKVRGLRRIDPSDLGRLLKERRVDKGRRTTRSRRR